MNKAFTRFTTSITQWLGSSTALILSIVIIVIWALAGPFMDFSNTWQLICNTSTTIVTFWMIFVVQNTQNRDSKALHTKLDEILDILDEDSATFIDLEELTEEEIDEIKEEIRKRQED